MSRSSLILANGRIFDPGRGIDIEGSLLIEDGLIGGIVGVDCPSDATAERTIDARGRLVTPGLIDLHVHLRQPGQEHKETIASGSRAAAAGGFTTICCMANTSPPVDNRGQLEFVRATASREAIVRVYPLAAVTVGMRGEELTEMGDLADAGAIAFSDDGVPLRSGRVMRHALEYARTFSRPLMPHCDDPDLIAGASMHEGAVAARLGLRGMPAASEEAAVARDVALCGLTGGRLHVCHVSTAGAVEIIRLGKRRGFPVTAEATPHHLSITDEWVAGVRWDGRGEPYDTHTKMNPPLRSEADRRALIAGLLDGTIDAIATDHAPHAVVDKEVEFDDAAFGITGLETALGVLGRLIAQGELPLDLVIERLTRGPARVFGLPYGSLAPGAPADVTVIDPTVAWTVRPEEFVSKGRNSPYVGQTLIGRADLTVVGGAVVFER